jgi:hypothetical protein
MQRSSNGMGSVLEEWREWYVWHACHPAALSDRGVTGRGRGKGRRPAQPSALGQLLLPRQAPAAQVSSQAAKSAS